MTKDPIVIHPSSPVSTAARILHEHGFQALPVVDRRALIGIVTSQGIIDSLGHHLGADIRGVEMTIDLPNDLVDLHRLTDALTALDPRPGALSLTIRLSKHEHRARLRLASPGPLHVAETFATAGFRVSRLHYEPLPDAEDPA
jgi:CBS-domain-containing membrane protein